MRVFSVWYFHRDSLYISVMYSELATVLAYSICLLDGIDVEAGVWSALWDWWWYFGDWILRLGHQKTKRTENSIGR